MNQPNTIQKGVAPQYRIFEYATETTSPIDELSRSLAEQRETELRTLAPFLYDEWFIEEILYQLDSNLPNQSLPGRVFDDETLSLAAVLEGCRQTKGYRFLVSPDFQVVAHDICFEEALESSEGLELFRFETDCLQGLVSILFEDGGFDSSRTEDLRAAAQRLADHVVLSATEACDFELENWIREQEVSA